MKYDRRWVNEIMKHTNNEPIEPLEKITLIQVMCEFLVMFLWWFVLVPLFLYVLVRIMFIIRG